MTTQKIESALSLASAAFALAHEANSAGGAFSLQTYQGNKNGVFGHAAAAAKRALEIVFDAQVAQEVCDKVWDCGEFGVDDLRRFVREVRLANFATMPHMWAEEGNRESWYEITVWHMSDVADIVATCKSDYPDDVQGFQEDLLCELVGYHADRLLHGAYGAPGQAFVHPATLTITETHVVLRCRGGLDI